MINSSLKFILFLMMSFILIVLQDWCMMLQRRTTHHSTSEEGCCSLEAVSVAFCSYRAWKKTTRVTTRDSTRMYEVKHRGIWSAGPTINFNCWSSSSRGLCFFPLIKISHDESALWMWIVFFCGGVCFLNLTRSFSSNKSFSLFSLRGIGFLELDFLPGNLLLSVDLHQVLLTSAARRLFMHHVNFIFSIQNLFIIQS